MSTASQPVGKKRLKKPKVAGRPTKKLKIDGGGSKEVGNDQLCGSNSTEDEGGEGENDDIDWKKLEEVLEESAQKANLTTINVKSILHHILRDKRVIDYAQNVAEFDGTSPLPDDNIAENTQMTRSKAKLLGQQPILSVLETPKKSILDLEFSESSSSDEDYEPAGGHDTEASQTSDDDWSEMLSDITGDIRSPRSVVSIGKGDPLTPMLESINEETIENGVVINKGPSNTVLIKTPRKNQLYPNTTASQMPNRSTPSSHADLIATRTRSQYPLQNIELEELEALFQPPDFEPPEFVPEDLDDEELIWQGWLADLTKPAKSSGLNETHDDADDEDFNYMAAAAEETEIEEELRDDRATRITQKELQELFNELLLGYNRDALENCDEIIHELYDERDQGNKSKQRFNMPSNEIIEATKNLHITFEQRQQMTAQLQQHVQLLTQVYMLSCTYPDLRDEAHQCKQYVEELAVFHDKAVQNSHELIGSLCAELSMFCTPGISQAYSITKSLIGQKIVTKTPKNGNKKAKRNLPISDTIASIFCTDPYFATYIELLPKQGIQNTVIKDRVRRMKFLQCEDNLLALGLHQFKGQGKFELICQHLLPIKEPRQLQIRVKNACTLRVKYNPIAVIKKEKYLPEFENSINIVVPRDISSLPLYKLPKRIWKNRLVPDWYLKIYRTLATEDKKTENNQVLRNYERSNDLFSLIQKDQPTNVMNVGSSSTSAALPVPQPPGGYTYSTPVQILRSSQQFVKLYKSAPVVLSNNNQQFQNNFTTISNTTVKPNMVTTSDVSAMKNRVSRSLSYSEATPEQSENTSLQTAHNNCSSTSLSKENTSGDGFSLPMNVLMKDLPMPETFPQINFSPSKPLHETSFSEVKQLLKTPQKTKPGKCSEIITLNLTPRNKFHIDDTSLKTPQKVEQIERDLNESLAEISGSEHYDSPMKSPDGFDRLPNQLTDTTGTNLDGNPQFIEPPQSYGKEKEVQENILNLPLSQGVSQATLVTRSTTITLENTQQKSNPTDMSGRPRPSLDNIDNMQTSVVDANTELTKISSKSGNQVDTITTPPESGTNSVKKDGIKRNSMKKPAQMKRKKKAVFNYDERLKQRAIDFAEIYFTRVREVLADRPDLCNSFFLLMQSVNKHLSKLETYHKLAELLQGYPELVDNYVGFLEQHEARHIGKYMEWLQFDLVIRFHLQCEQQFFGVPGHYQKITKKILEVTSRTQISREIVNQVSPLFQGDQSLQNLFIRLFPDLSPPPCNDDDFEVIDFGAVSSGLKEIDDFEEVAYQPPDLDHSLVFADDDHSHNLPPISSRATFKSPPDAIPFQVSTSRVSYTKRRSSKTITAKKLKQLATKRKKMKEKRERHFRASPTSGEDNYHDDDDDAFDDEDFNYSRLSGEEESCFPVGNTERDEDPLNFEHSSKTNESFPKSPSPEEKKPPQKPCEENEARSPNGKCLKKELPMSGGIDVENEQSNVSIKSCDNIFYILNKDTKEKSLNASDLTFHSHSLSSDTSTIEKVEGAVKESNDQETNASKLESSVDVDFSVVSSSAKTHPEFVIDLCSVSSSIGENKPAAGMNVMEKVLDDARKESTSILTEADTEVERIMFQKRPIPHVHFSTPKVKSLSPEAAKADSTTDNDGPFKMQGRLSTISEVTFDKSADGVINMKEKGCAQLDRDTSIQMNESSRSYSVKTATVTQPKFDKHSNISLCNDLTFPEFPSASNDCKSLLTKPTGTSVSVKEKIDTKQNISTSEVSLQYDLTFPGFPSTANTSVVSPFETQGILGVAIEKPSNSSQRSLDNSSAINITEETKHESKDEMESSKEPPPRCKQFKIQPKFPRRLSQEELVTITTEIDQSLFYSDDSISSTISCVSPSISPRKLRTIQEARKLRNTKKRRLRKTEIKTLSERKDNKDQFSDNDDYFESRSVESVYDPNTGCIGSPNAIESTYSKPLLKHSISCPSIKKVSNKKTKVNKKPKRRLKSNEIKTISERKEKNQFSDEDDDKFVSWSVGSSYDPNSSFISPPSVEVNVETSRQGESSTAFVSPLSNTTVSPSTSLKSLPPAETSKQGDISKRLVSLDSNTTKSQKQSPFTSSNSSPLAEISRHGESSTAFAFPLSKTTENQKVSPSKSFNSSPSIETSKHGENSTAFISPQSSMTDIRRVSPSTGSKHSQPAETLRHDVNDALLVSSVSNTTENQKQPPSIKSSPLVALSSTNHSDLDTESNNVEVSERSVITLSNETKRAAGVSLVQTDRIAHYHTLTAETVSGTKLKHELQVNDSTGQTEIFDARAKDENLLNSNLKPEKTSAFSKDIRKEITLTKTGCTEETQGTFVKSATSEEQPIGSAISKEILSTKAGLPSLEERSSTAEKKHSIERNEEKPVETLLSKRNVEIPSNNVESISVKDNQQLNESELTNTRKEESFEPSLFTVSSDPAKTASEDTIDENKRQLNESESIEEQDPMANKEEKTTREWTRSEDELILVTLQRQGDRPETFQKISTQLQNRSPGEVKHRFKFLLQHLVGGDDTASSSDEDDSSSSEEEGGSPS